MSAHDDTLPLALVAAPGTARPAVVQHQWLPATFTNTAYSFGGPAFPQVLPYIGVNSHDMAMSSLPPVTQLFSYGVLSASEAQRGYVPIQQRQPAIRQFSGLLEFDNANGHLRPPSSDNDRHSLRSGSRQSECPTRWTPTHTSSCTSASSMRSNSTAPSRSSRGSPAEHGMGRTLTRASRAPSNITGLIQKKSRRGKRRQAEEDSDTVSARSRSSRGSSAEHGIDRSAIRASHAPSQMAGPIQKKSGRGKRRQTEEDSDTVSARSRSSRGSSAEHGIDRSAIRASHAPSQMAGPIQKKSGRGKRRQTEEDSDTESDYSHQSSADGQSSSEVIRDPEILDARNHVNTASAFCKGDFWIEPPKCYAIKPSTGERYAEVQYLSGYKRLGSLKLTSDVRKRMRRTRWREEIPMLSDDEEDAVLRRMTIEKRLLAVPDQEDPDAPATSNGKAAKRFRCYYCKRIYENNNKTYLNCLRHIGGGLDGSTTRYPCNIFLKENYPGRSKRTFGSRADTGILKRVIHVYDDGTEVERNCEWNLPCWEGKSSTR